MLTKIKNTCKCAPVEYQLLKCTEKHTLYLVDCKFCGNHIKVLLKGSTGKINGVKRADDNKEVKLKLTYNAKDKDWYSELNLKVFPKSLKFEKKEVEVISKDKQKSILYEGLADGDIDIDTFNNWIVKLM